MPSPVLDADRWNWENAVAGATAGFTTVVSLHPLDVVRTRFQVNDGRALSVVPVYKNTAHAIYIIARTEGLKGLYAGFYPAVFGSSVSWGLYFFFYNKAKSRYLKDANKDLSPWYHLISAAEAGIWASLLTNPIWLVKTRLQLQASHHYHQPYSGFSDALRTILKEEGWHALYRGLGPSLLLVTHGAIQFTAYEELRKAAVYMKSKKEASSNGDKLNFFEASSFGVNLNVKLVQDSKELMETRNSFDYAILGASSKLAAILFTYPYQVIRARLQQRPISGGVPKYSSSWHVVKETARFEGVRGFYRGMTSNILKNIPASSITFVVYENVLKLLKTASGSS